MSGYRVAHSVWRSFGMTSPGDPMGTQTFWSRSLAASVLFGQSRQTGQVPRPAWISFETWTSVNVSYYLSPIQVWISFPLPVPWVHPDTNPPWATIIFCRELSRLSFLLGKVGCKTVWHVYVVVWRCLIFMSVWPHCKWSLWFFAGGLWNNQLGNT